MVSLETSGMEIALVVDENDVLRGTLTDGDIRRALLRGAALQSPLASYLQRLFTSVHPDVGRAEVLDLMQARTINQIPVVDAKGRLVGLHVLHDFVGTAQRENWAVIMAGGRGERLRPITDAIPKPMIPVAGRPILERLVLHLVGHGVRRVFISINYLGHMVEQHFGTGEHLGCSIEYLRESSPLGTCGALSLLPETPSCPLLVINGDLLTRVNIGGMFDFHNAGAFVSTMGVRQYDHAIPYGCVEVENGRVRRLEEKPVLTKLINAGIYIIQPELILEIPHEQEYPMTTLLERKMVAGLSVGAFFVEDDWLDIGQREQLKLAREGSATR
jgi:dTDP-glucose pyrophosphorylase